MDEIDDGWDDNEEIGEVEDGWGDDELDLLNDDNDDDNDNNDDDDELAALNRETFSSNVSVDEGWDWNDNGGNVSTHDDTDADAVPTRTTRIAPPPAAPVRVPVRAAVAVAVAVDPSTLMVEQKLLEYIHQLQEVSLLNSLNQELELKHNNPETALELCRYYHERENLREYTLDAEVPRMDYQIMISDAMILTETHEIQQHFRDHPVDNLVDDMLLRASNQSLLADIFPVITGPNKIIRMQFGANAVATKCRLVLDMRGMVRTLQVECTMTISIPSGMSAAAAAKLDLAALRLMINFSPDPTAPFVKYQLVSMHTLLDANLDADREKIRAASEEMDHDQIMEQTMHMQEMMPATATRNSANVRDNFLNSIVSTHTHTAAGFKSALRDIDDVVNVSSKLNYLKKVSAAAMPVLPSADEIMTAEEQGIGSHAGSGSVSAESTRPTGSGSGSFVRSSIPESSFQPAPPPPRTRTSSHTDVSATCRPKPIIGGMLLSGITRLAKAAAIPEQETIPTLYRKESVPPPLPPPMSTYPTDIPGKGPTIETTIQAPVKASKSYHLSSSAGALDDTINGDSLDDDLSAGGWSDDGLDGDLDEDDDDDGDDDDDDDLDVALNDTLPISNQPEPSDAGIDNYVGIPIPPSDDTQNQESQSKLPLPLADGTEESRPETNELPSELRAERDFLLQKLAMIHSTNIENGLNSSSIEEFVYDVSTGIIPTRKRFVSRSELLNLRAKQTNTQ